MLFNLIEKLPIVQTIQLKDIKQIESGNMKTIESMSQYYKMKYAHVV